MGSRRPLDALCATFLWGWRWFLPPSPTPDESFHAQRVLMFCLGLSIWVPLSGIGYHKLGVPIAVDILLISAVPLAAIPFLLRYSRRTTLCGNLLAALALTIYTALALVTGGPAAPVAPWFVAVPIIAMFLTGPRWGVVWTLLAMLTVCAFFAAREMAFVFPQPFPASLVHILQWAALIRLGLFIAVLTLLFRAVDLRQRTALKEALSAAQAADRAKSEFLANMSHEIRTPLTAILGYTELLREGTRHPGETLRISHGDALETIHRNGEHLLQVINDILDLSKIEARRLDLEQVYASPRQIVAEVMALFAARASAKDVRLESHFDAELPDAIETDPTRLRQVLANIMGNAVKFTEEGTVHIEARWQGPRTGPATIEFAIRDSGIGMTQQVVGRLFQPFTQADGSTSRRYGGTGLGLAICSRLVQMMGGAIEVASEPEKGSCFTVRLPVDHARSRNADTVAITGDERASPAHATAFCGAEATGLAGCRILLAEDSADNQRLIRHLLHSAGAEVTLAENGQLAVDLALTELDRESAFDLILMDMQMPVLDGYEATSRLRAAGYWQPIVALTAHALRAEHDKCRAAGCDDVCTKPIERAAFFAALRRRLRKRDASSLTSRSGCCDRKPPIRGEVRLPA
ncbi:MAG TPA: ATP-binding protein [Pirellulales bacterium]|nr:ATP-binding protein [Pirellulales bacterium]